MIKTEFSPIKPEALKLKWPRLSPLAWIFAGVVLFGSWFLFPEGGFDWRNDIGPGTRHWWPAPWEHGLILAPWGAALLSPLWGLPHQIATALTNGMSVLVFALVARKLGGPDWIGIPVSEYQLAQLSGHDDHLGREVAQMGPHRLGAHVGFWN
jgi:hypothetical protein